MKRVRGWLIVVPLMWMPFSSHTAEYKPRLDQPGKDVVWVPTPDSLVDKMLDLAQVGANDFVVDLGSGDGRLVILAAKRGAKALGIEYDASLVDYARAAAAKAGVANTAQFVRADLFASDFSKATVVTVFLGPELNQKLLPKLLGLRPGTRVVSNTHPIGDWPADETAHSADDEKSVYYRTARLWVVPAQVAGAWQSPDGSLLLKQRYQTVSGIVRQRRGAKPVTHGILRGDQIRLNGDGVHYAGKVVGNEIIGTVTENGTSREWRAARRR